MNNKPKALMTTEKASVAKDIQAVYDKIKKDLPYEMDILPCAGHLFALCEPDEYENKEWKVWDSEHLPILIQPEEWLFKFANKNAASYYNAIKNAYFSNHYDFIINAGDAGREGQAIQHIVYRHLGVNIPIMRYWADDTSFATIEKNLRNLLDDKNFENLTNASFLRLYLDYLFGMNFTRAVTISTQSKTPIHVGRVMTPTLAEIVKREEEIKNFKPVGYWELEITFSSEGNLYKGKLQNPKDDMKFRFWDNSVIKEISNSINSVTTGQITKIQKEEQLFLPPTLYNLADLEKDAANKLGFRPSKTDDVAQSLYDKHVLSYPRTESKYITEEQLSDVPLMLQSISQIHEISSIVQVVMRNTFMIQAIASNKRYVNNKKVADHPALTPTTEVVDFEKLTKDEQSIYLLVAKRFLSIFLPPKKTLSTIVETQIGNYTCISKDNVTLDNGFMGLYKTEEKITTTLPSLVQGCNVNVYKQAILNKKTTPPSSYTYSTLIRMMESAGKTLDDEELEKVLMASAGLGTPATRSETIKKLLKLEYIKESKKNILPTERGVSIIHSLGNREITSAALTANWEKSLKAVENGNLTFNQVYDVMLEYTRKQTSDLLTLAPLPPQDNSLGVCPKCHNKIYESKKSYFCLGVIPQDNAPATCDFFLPKIYGHANITKTDVKNLLQGKETSEKNFTWKSGKKSSSKLKLIDAKLSFSDSLKETVGKCPKCGRDVLVGRTGYYCFGASRSQGTCDFSVYYKIGETEINKETAREIFSKGETRDVRKITFSSGKTISLRVKLSEDFSRFELVDPPAPINICPCPYCNNGVITFLYNNYRCSINTSEKATCDFKLYNTVGGATISHEEASKLLRREKIRKEVRTKTNPIRYSKEIEIAYKENEHRYVLNINWKS